MVGDRWDMNVRVVVGVILCKGRSLIMVFFILKFVWERGLVKLEEMGFS